MNPRDSREQDRSTMPAGEMGDLVARLVARHGPGLLESRRRLLGLLRDHAPDQTRAIRLMLTAYDEGIPERIAAEGVALPAVRVDREVALLVSNAGIQPELARWAVEVWHAGLSAVPAAVPPATPAAAAVPLAPTIAPAAAPLPTAPRADDLTWGSEVVQTPPAVPIAPSVAPPAPSAPVAPPAAAPAPQRPWVRYVTIAAAMIVGLSGLTKLANFGGGDPPPARETPAAPSPAPAPAAPTPAPRAPDPPRAAPEAPTKRHVVASRSNDTDDWPTFSGAAHPDGVATAWQFQFNLDAGDGRVVAYNVYTNLDRSLRSGSGSVRALDLRHDSPDMVSSTPNLTVVREHDTAAGAFFTRINTTSWAKNPSNAPNICVLFHSGTQAQSFQPEKGAFCVFELAGGACTRKRLGCGRLE